MRSIQGRRPDTVGRKLLSDGFDDGWRCEMKLSVGRHNLKIAQTSRRSSVSCIFDDEPIELRMFNAVTPQNREAHQAFSSLGEPGYLLNIQPCNHGFSDFAN